MHLYSLVCFSLHYSKLPSLILASPRNSYTHKCCRLASITCAFILNGFLEAKKKTVSCVAVVILLCVFFSPFFSLSLSRTRYRVPVSCLSLNFFYPHTILPILPLINRDSKIYSAPEQRLCTLVIARRKTQKFKEKKNTIFFFFYILIYEIRQQKYIEANGTK